MPPVLMSLQQTVPAPHSGNSGVERTRRINIRTAHDGYDKSKVLQDIGSTYRIVIWHEDPDSFAREVTVTGTSKHCPFSANMDLKAMVGTVPVEADDPKTGIYIEQGI